MTSYLAGLPDGVAERVADLNAPALGELTRRMTNESCVAFVGPDASEPLYPNSIQISELLLGEARGIGVPTELVVDAVATPVSQAEKLADAIKDSVGVATFGTILARLFSRRRDPATGATSSETQSAIAERNFRLVMTTAYDPGLVEAVTDATRHFAGQSMNSGFITYRHESAIRDIIDTWDARSGHPLIFAHGVHNRQSEILLGPSHYSRAYTGAMADLIRFCDRESTFVWIGHGSDVQRISVLHAHLRRCLAQSTAEPPNILAPDSDDVGEFDLPNLSPGFILLPIHDAEWEAYEAFMDDWPDAFGLTPILCPVVPGGRDSSVELVLQLPQRPPPPFTGLPGMRQPPRDGRAGIPLFLDPSLEVPRDFVARESELSRFDRWAGEPSVAVIGVSAWGGAGKTSLVSKWLSGEASVMRAGFAGVFAWSFYSDPSPQRWASAFLDWAHEVFDISTSTRDSEASLVELILDTLSRFRLLLVLDGMELLQESPASERFGLLTDAFLRDTIVRICRDEGLSVAILTSRFPFADLLQFDGTAARLLDLLPFTIDEGADFLATGVLSPPVPAVRRQLAAAVDGHVLALSVMRGLILARAPLAEIDRLRGELLAAEGLDSRVAKVLNFYGTRLDEPDRLIVSIVSLFNRPVSALDVLTTAKGHPSANMLDGWNSSNIVRAVETRLRGVLTISDQNQVSAHPLVREAFRGYGLGAAEVAVDCALSDVPATTVHAKDDALRVVEVIELLVDAGAIEAADQLAKSRTDDGRVWLTMPNPLLAERCARAFVGDDGRYHATAGQLGSDRALEYLNLWSLALSNCGRGSMAADVALRLEGAVAGDRHADRALVLRRCVECRVALGRYSDAAHYAQRAYVSAELSRDKLSMKRSLAYLAWVASLQGDTLRAERIFDRANTLSHDVDGRRLYSFTAYLWADFLLATRRFSAARSVIDSSLELVGRYGWQQDRGRFLRISAQLEAIQDVDAAVQDIEIAERIFRDGTMLGELAPTLVVAAKLSRLAGEPRRASNYVNEAIDIADSTEHVVTRAEALAERAILYAESSSEGRWRIHDSQKAIDDLEVALRIADSVGAPWTTLHIRRAERIVREATSTESPPYDVSYLENRLIPSTLADRIVDWE